MFKKTKKVNSFTKLPVDKEINVWVDNDRVTEIKSVYQKDMSVKDKKNNRQKDEILLLMLHQIKQVK